MILSTSWWQLEAESGHPSEPIRVCPHRGNFSCAWGTFGHVTAAGRQVNETYISHLNLTQVTPRWRNQNLQCVVDEKEGPSNQSVTTCVMDIFYKPESPQCHVYKTRHNHLVLNCSTPRVYPRLVCHVTQLEVITFTTVDIKNKFSYLEEVYSYQGIDYYKSSCSVEISNVKPGLYQYFAVLGPAVRYTGYIRNITVAVMPTPPVRIERQMTVRLSYSAPVILCPGTSPTLSFTCLAKDFESQPEFVWHLWDPTLKESQNDTFSYLENSQHGLDYISRTNMAARPNHADKHVICAAVWGNVTISDQVKLKVNVYQHFRHLTPVFRSKDGHELNGSLLISMNNTSTVACSVDAAGEEEDYTVRVKCHSHQVLVEKISHSEYITFEVMGDQKTNGSSCTCTVTHRCYTSHTRLSLKIMPAEIKTLTADSVLTSNIPERRVEFYVFLSAVCLLVVLLLCGACIKLLHVLLVRWNNLLCLYRDRRDIDSHIYEVVR